MKTLKQIADELGVPKQQVYRYVKAECINEVHHEALEARRSKSVKYYNEAAESTIKAYFQGKVQPIEVHHEAAEAHHDVHHEAEPESLKSVIEAMQAGHAAEVKRLVDQLDQLRQDHREELDRIQAGHAAEVKRLEKQIDDMRAQLDTLAQLTQNAQTLHAAQLQKEERKAIETAAPPEEITPQDKPPTFWQRIFGRK